MGFTCKIFGHKWNGCKCERCGTIREDRHNWSIIEGKCIEKCSVCGKERNIEHKWSILKGKCIEKCSICGKERSIEHKWSLVDGKEKCLKCGIEMTPIEKMKQRERDNQIHNDIVSTCKQVAKNLEGQVIFTKSRSGGGHGELDHRVYRAISQIFCKKCNKKTNHELTYVALFNNGILNPSMRGKFSGYYNPNGGFYNSGLQLGIVCKKCGEKSAMFV